jgi:hypothetical protein
LRFFINKKMGIGDWGIGDWGIGPNPQSPIPQSPFTGLKNIIFFIDVFFRISQFLNNKYNIMINIIVYYF